MRIGKGKGMALCMGGAGAISWAEARPLHWLWHGLWHGHTHEHRMVIVMVIGMATMIIMAVRMLSVMMI